MGTAPEDEAYLFLELPKPWPAKIKKMEGLVSEIRGVLKKHKNEEVKLIGTPEFPWLEPSPYPRALLVRWDGRQAVQRTLPAREDSLRQALAEPVSGEPFECYIVCTHGSRDPCCGLLGVPIYKALEEAGQRPVIQVSHLGGHRFAPVVGVFPEWRYYGHLTPDSVRAMDKALGEKQPFLHGYRGWGRLPEAVQPVEAKLWAEHGAALGEVRILRYDKTEPLIECHLRDGSTIRYRAILERYEYQGYKSCKDFKEGKESKLKLPRLKQLLRESSHAPSSR